MRNSNYNSIFVGMRGVFTATGQFANMFNNQLNYTCIAIEDIDGMIARGRDPYNEVYMANNVSSQQYFNDDTAGIPLYTFQSNIGNIFTIPGSNIIGMPDVNGVRYSNLMLGISLSALPDAYNLEAIKREISDLIFNRIGVRSEVKSITFGSPSLITQQDHLAVNNARMGNVSNNQSVLSSVNLLTNQNTSLLNKVSILENFVKGLI